MHHLQRKHCTMNSGIDAPPQTVSMHHGQRSACTIRRGVFSRSETETGTGGVALIQGVAITAEKV